MARRIGESIEVRLSGDPAEAPMSFLWRGRLYVVRSVLGHWLERREWWTASAARALHGEEASPGTAQATLDREREIWRVEASAGRVFGSGVYDLCLEPEDGSGPEAAPAWRLIQVAD
jgi:Family of unknown function (DUF6504)